MGRKRLGDLLKERGRVSQNDIESAVLEQQRSSARLGELLLQRGLVDRDELISALEEITHTKYVDCSTAQVDPQVLNLIPRAVAARCCVLPLFLERKRLAVIMAEPQNLSVINELKFMSSIDISPRLGFAAEIQAAIETHYGSEAKETDEAKGRAKDENLLQIEEGDASGIEFFTNETRGGEEEALKELHAAMGKQRTPAVRLFSAIVAKAADKKASDIHIDPQANNTVIRLRVDGILHDLLQVPLQIQESLVSRIKILASMDIAERRTPQDGRIMVRVGPHKLDLRAATLSTHYGEKVVIRLLDPRAGRISFADLGFSPHQLNVVTDILSNPQCMFLVTGPTGSGKTTTLYAALNYVRSRAVNVITVEDPIEYMIEGINQVQVHTKAGRTFAKCLRSILRQDPNVIMVGEIRDQETAEIALTASQTGHMVLSTLHTNDSVSAIMRLADLGVPAALIASSMTAVIAQRLVRKLCACREEAAMSPQYAARLSAGGFTEFEGKMLVPVGCPACDGTGYKGRVGVFEILTLDEELRQLIRAAASPAQMHSHIRTTGLRSFQEEALDKVRQGLTSFEEIFRVIPFNADHPSRCSSCKRHLTPDFLLCPYCGAKRAGSKAEEEAGAQLQPVGKGGASS
jgi:type IV pilus assembly protein PilB